MDKIESHLLDNLTINCSDELNNFEEIRESDIFDKTLFIKQVLNNKLNKILITAPPNFGKTTNLENLKQFIEIPVNKNGLVADRENSANYHLFARNNYLIYQDHNFFQENFGTYPVIYVSFERISGKKFYEIVTEFRRYLNLSFIEHCYLLKSNKLDEEEINQFKKYYYYDLCLYLNKTEIIEGFEFLAKCLSKYFDGKKAFLLIDNYDDPIRNILFENDAFDSVCHVFKLYSQILSNTLNSKYIERAVLTGVHNLDVFGPLDIGKYQFLDDNPFIEFHGLTELELYPFLMNFRGLEEHYEAYVSVKGIKFFSIHSILSFMADNINDDDYFQERFHKKENTAIPIIRYAITKLCLNRSLIIKIIRKFEMKHVHEFKQIFLINLNSEMIQFKKPDLFLNCILHKGYLIYEKIIDTNFCQVKLAKNPISSYLKRDLTSYYNNVYGCFFNMNECVNIFDEISPSSEDEIFNRFIIEFNKTLKKSKLENNVHNFHNLIYDILCQTNFVIGDEGLTFTNGLPDLIFCKENFEIAIQITCNICVKTALEQIIEKCRSVFNKESSTTRMKDIIYLGLNVNKNSTANMSVLVNSTDLSKMNCY